MRKRWLSILPAVSRSSRRRVAEIVGGWLLAALICWYFGVDAWHALLLGCAATVISLALLAGRAAPRVGDLSWRVLRRGARAGTRGDVATLASALRGGWGYVGLGAEQELQAIARHRLALDGLDLNDATHRAAIERRVGVDAYLVLIKARGRVATLKELLECLDRLDEIGES